MIDRNAHRLRSAHRCICGWEGDDAITHIIDALGIEQAEGVYLRNGRPILALGDDMPMRGVEVLYRIGRVTDPAEEGA